MGIDKRKINRYEQADSLECKVKHLLNRTSGIISTIKYVRIEMKCNLKTAVEYVNGVKKEMELENLKGE